MEFFMMEKNQEKTEREKKLLKNQIPDADDAVHQELKACKEAQAEWKDKCIRATADLANYKRRTEKEKITWMQMARADLLEKLLPVIDNFDRALDTEEVSEGVKLIYNSFQEYLKDAGVQEVAYETFDPNLHEALMQVESYKHKAGQVIEVMEKGYRIGGAILRPAKVSVAK